MASRTEKLRRRQHRKDKKRGARGPGSELARSGNVLTVNPPGAAKMSEALHDLVEPEWNRCQDEVAMRKLLTLGVAAWNAALIEGAERTAFLEHLAESLPIELRQDFKHVLEPLIRRKKELFPHIQRPILSFELTWPSGKPYLMVISGLA
jgi:hypothetical protein